MKKLLGVLLSNKLKIDRHNKMDRLLPLNAVKKGQAQK